MASRGRILVEAALAQIKPTNTKRKQQCEKMTIHDKANAKKVRLNERKEKKMKEAEKENVKESRSRKQLENQTITRGEKNIDQTENKAEKENVEESQSGEQLENQTMTRGEQNIDETENEAEKENVEESQSGEQLESQTMTRGEQNIDETENEAEKENVEESQSGEQLESQTMTRGEQNIDETENEAEKENVEESQSGEQLESQTMTRGEQNIDETENEAEKENVEESHSGKQLENQTMTRGEKNIDQTENEAEKENVEESQSGEQLENQTKTTEKKDTDQIGNGIQKKNVTIKIPNKEDRKTVESAMTPGCSLWESCDRPAEEKHAMRLRLRRVAKEKKDSETYTDESVMMEEDVEDTDEDPDVDSSSSYSSSSDTSSVDDESSTESLLQKRRKNLPEAQLEKPNEEEKIPGGDEKKKGKKIRARPSLWEKNKSQIGRNKGESYISRSKNRQKVKPRAIRPPCTDKCKLECSRTISQETRQGLFKAFWELGNLQLQREYIARSMTQVNPLYRYTREGSTRGLNHAFHFMIGEKNVRVCKTFFKATLDINDRPIRTVITKTKNGIIEAEKRGKHGKQISVDPVIKEGIRDHINSIPRVESHYLRAQTTREYIEGGKTIASLHRDYVVNCAERNVRAGNLTMYTRIFNEEFNISFFSPKKDQCELCTAFNNAKNEEKAQLQEKYDTHLKEKVLSRQEKQKDKELAAENEHHVVATYDLQAVLPVPRGEVSVFYYKSKLNSYNFTVSEMKSGYVECFFWHEGEANRGAIEIGSCVLKYLERTAQAKNDDDLEIVFFSDNCCGQQKNKFVLGMYLYAVQKLKIKSITHKFLIKGHTQNEGDSIHSVIEKAIKRALKTGPIYIPSEYVRIIRSAKVTGAPYKVTEMCHSDFINLKQLTPQLGPNFTNTTDNAVIKMGDIKVVKVLKDEPGIMYVKTSYEQNEYMKINVNGKRRNTVNISQIKCKPAYSKKMTIADRKKSDILDLLKANHVPKFYEPLYKLIFN